MFTIEKALVYATHFILANTARRFYSSHKVCHIAVWQSACSIGQNVSPQNSVEPQKPMHVLIQQYICLMIPYIFLFVSVLFSYLSIFLLTTVIGLTFFI